MSEASAETNKPRGIADQILDSVLKIASGGSEDDFSKLMLDINEKLLPDPDFHRGTFIDEEKFKQDYAREFERLKVEKEDSGFYVTLGDGLHRLAIYIDRQYPKYNSVTLSHSAIHPAPEVLERWQELTSKQQLGIEKT